MTRLFLAAAAVVVAEPALAVQEVTLVARPFVKTMPDGVEIPMWGFALDPDGDGAAEPGPTTSPGPLIEVPAAETTLRITLRNELDVPVSLAIPGQLAATNPTWIDAAGNVTAVGARASGDYTSRMRSLMTETAPGATGIYEWTGLREGTFLYRSATHPQVQVPMGLYGAVTKDAAEGQAYGRSYADELILLYSEIDPGLNRAVADGLYGSEAYPSTIGYTPKYFLVNGEPYPMARGLLSGALAGGEALLVRMLNAGLENHIPVADNARLLVVAEDGFPYPHARDQQAVLLPAGKTKDALLQVAASGTLTIYDRALNLTNDRAPGGGMLVRLAVPSPAAPDARDDWYRTAAGEALAVGAAEGVLFNDIDLQGGTLSAELRTPPANGTAVLAADGSFTYTPADATFTGSDSFTYVATDPEGNQSGEATVRVAVVLQSVAPPVVDDAYALAEDQPLSVAAPGVLANDGSDPATVSAKWVSGPEHGSLTLNADGSFVYSPVPDYFGADSFGYIATDGAANSTVANVAITIDPVNDAPFAAADTAETRRDRSVSINLVANDSDRDGTIDPTTVAIARPPMGSLVLGTDGTVTYKPPAGYVGYDSFAYTVKDDGGLPSNAAEVGVTVTGKNRK